MTLDAIWYVESGVSALLFGTMIFNHKQSRMSAWEWFCVTLATPFWWLFLAIYLVVKACDYWVSGKSDWEKNKAFRKQLDECKKRGYSFDVGHEYASISHSGLEQPRVYVGPSAFKLAVEWALEQ